MWVDMLKRYLFLALIALGGLIPASAQTTVFNCSSFSSSGACGVNTSGGAANFLMPGNGPPSLSGSRVLLMPQGAVHQGDALNWSLARVNDQAFTTSFTFIPNGWNVAFVLQNNTNTDAAPEGAAFAAGAGCEAGFYQAFTNNNQPPTDIFALELDSQSYLNSSETFTYSSVQIYKQGQSPCNPNDGQPNYYLTDKISTSPVALTSPANALGSTTGDTYSATITYDGTNVVLNLYDVTAGGSCPGSSCFTYTWTGVDIPSLVNSSTAWVGLTTATNGGSSYPLYINSFSYTSGASSTPPPTVATPTFSPGAGTYSSTQSVTLSDATSGASIYYTENGSTPTTSSTKYTNPVTINSTETLQAIAVATGDSNSGVASAAYTISIPSVSTPTLSPGAGTYSSAQSVRISDSTSGATIYYTTNGSTPTTSSTEYSGPITVGSTETVEAIAAAAGYTNSKAGSAAYSISSSSSQPGASTPTFSPAAGAYTSAQAVTLSDATSGATIYYTTDGSTPTASSTQYSGPITVSSTGTLQAIAVATGDTNSAVASATYTISATLPSVSTPTFSPAAGTYTSAQSVTISDATPGATIYYTTNGSTPTTSSTQYSGPISVSSTETLQAIAAATNNSAVASAAYTITAQPNFVLGTSAPSLTLTSGAQGTVLLTVTPENGFNSPVVLACSALPTWATCSFDQATVTPSGGAVSTQLTISTMAQSSALRPGSRPFVPLTALAMTVCLFGWRKRRGRHHWLLLVVAYAGLGLLFGCGGTSAGGGGTSSTATPQVTTSTVTVTAISGTLQGTAAIALTVQ
jgi:Chitobiase/beta-hexosaminidase C-terminal domain